MLILDYLSLDKSELIKEREKLQKDYDAFKAQGLSLNMARGKPCTEQLDLSMAMLDTVNAKSEMLASTGDDCRNYGLPGWFAGVTRYFCRYDGGTCGQCAYRRQFQP